MKLLTQLYAELGKAASARPRIGEILVERRVITRTQLERILEEQKRQPSKPFGAIARDLRIISGARIERALEAYHATGGTRASTSMRSKTESQAGSLSSRRIQRAHPASPRGGREHDGGKQRQWVWLRERVELIGVGRRSIRRCAAAFVCAVVALYIFFPSGASLKEVEVGETSDTVARESVGRFVAAAGPFKVKSEGTQTVVQIAEYDELLRRAPRSSDAPVTQLRIANLYYSRLHDYANAALEYEKLLSTFPNWDHPQEVYTSLAICYKHLKDRARELQTYRRMMETSSEDTDLYRLARWSLGW